MTDDPRDVAERWFDSLARMDIDAFAATMHDDVVFNVAGRTAVSGRCIGKRALLERVLPLVVANLDPASINLARHHRIMAVDGPMVVGLMQGGAMTRDGQAYEQTYCDIFRIEDGRITEVWEFFDTVQAEARLFGKPIEVGAPIPDGFVF